ncbi:restriction endonuclease subunit S [Rothia terrae]|uniref:Restriction endonuclease subunit S n=1 Tax=Rothia terrae TaxID=396015 RepID=A0A7H2BBH1_9MICC|nr:restriction endonuclease subunit S [Rothia terrae]QNV37017.1 restriction endonuclease subunit S [Rothia terrae]
MSNEVPFNIRWLSGGVPDHWQIVEPRRIFKLVKEPERPGDIHLTPSQKYGVLPQEEYMKITGARVVQNLSGTQMQHVEPGDFISHLRTFQGGLELATMPGKVSPAYTVLRPTEAVYPGFFKHVLKSPGYVSQIASVTDQLRDGQTMRYNEFNLTWLPLPPLEEQKRIADELDRELAEIDEFIDDQQRLLNLSMEQYSSQIHELVTKGHEKDVDLVDSAFDWIGSLPAHWSIQKISWLFNDIGSGTTPSSADESAFLDGTINWVTTGELREAGVSKSKNQINEDTLNKYSALKLHPAGSIMIAMYGATIGRLGWLEEPATVNQAVCVLSNPKKVLPKYVFYVLMVAKPHLLNQATGGGQPNINQDTIRNLRIPVPPISEQEMIILQAERLDTNLFKLISSFNKLNSYFREKRISLLTSHINRLN